LRICFGAASDERLDEAMDRLQALLEQHGPGLADLIPGR
jgi:DNA-binding transcriptional MocR family regulator